MLLRRIRSAILLFATVTLAGTVGYRWIEGWSWLDSLWMVVITLTTIGYGEAHPLSDAGRVFTLALIAGGLSTASYAVASITQFVLAGELRQNYLALLRKRRMDSLTNHFIVAGFGRTGREIVAELTHAGEHVVIIDPDPLSEIRCEAAGFAFLLGDASSDHTLREAGIERAKGLAVATASDAVNVFVTLTARQLSPKLKIMTRVDHEETAAKAMRAGANGVVSPHTLGGTTLANGLLRPHSATFMANAFTRSQADLAMEDVEIGPSTGWHGSLKTLRLHELYRVIVVALKRQSGELETAPGPDVEVRQGDVLVVVGRPEHVRIARAAAAKPRNA